jgi:hypothetical protein
VALFSCPPCARDAPEAYAAHLERLSASPLASTTALDYAARRARCPAVPILRGGGGSCALLPPTDLPGRTELRDLRHLAVARYSAREAPGAAPGAAGSGASAAAQGEQGEQSGSEGEEAAASPAKSPSIVTAAQGGQASEGEEVAAAPPAKIKSPSPRATATAASAAAATTSPRAASPKALSPRMAAQNSQRAV